MSDFSHKAMFCMPTNVFKGHPKSRFQKNILTQSTFQPATPIDQRDLGFSGFLLVLERF